MSDRLQKDLKQSKPFASSAEAVSVGLLRTSHLIRRYADQKMETFGLTLQQYNVLRILRGAKAPLPTMEIGERLVEPTPGITRMMSRIENNQWAVYEAGKDRRQKLWVLTPKGREVLEQGDIVTQNLNRMISEALDETQLTRLSLDLEALRELV
jgi:DNA-binding MarR family transcriptional regulator